MVIRIEGFDGQSDNPRFFGSPIFKPYEIKRDLPKEPCEQALEVPAALGLTAPTTPALPAASAIPALLVGMAGRDWVVASTMREAR